MRFDLHFCAMSRDLSSLEKRIEFIKIDRNDMSRKEEEELIPD